MDAQFLTITGAVLAVGFGLAGLMIRTMARLDRRIDNDKPPRMRTVARTKPGWGAFRAEMQRLAERQSTVEGRVAAD